MYIGVCVCTDLCGCKYNDGAQTHSLFRAQSQTGLQLQYAFLHCITHNPSFLITSVITILFRINLKEHLDYDSHNPLLLFPSVGRSLLDPYPACGTRLTSAVAFF